MEIDYKFCNVCGNEKLLSGRREASANLNTSKKYKKVKYIMELFKPFLPFRLIDLVRLSQIFSH
jgi:hypothetical protein